MTVSTRVLRHAPENAASLGVLEKPGMSYEGEFEDEGGRTLVYAVAAERLARSGEAAAAAEEREDEDEQRERRRDGG